MCGKQHLVQASEKMLHKHVTLLSVCIDCCVTMAASLVLPALLALFCFQTVSAMPISIEDHYLQPILQQCLVPNVACFPGLLCYT